MSGVRIKTPNIIDLVHHERGHARRNSTGTAFNGGVRILSRYLRPSLSSCHDFCKFGVERTLEMKAGVLWDMPKGKSAALGQGLDVGKTVISAERRKSLPVRLKSCPAPKPQKLDIPTFDGVVSPLTKEEYVSSEQLSPPVKDIELSGIHDDLKIKPSDDSKIKPLWLNESSHMMHGCLNTDGQMKVETSKKMGNPSTNSPRACSSRRRGKGIRKSLAPPSISSSPKHSPKKASGRNAGNSSNRKGISQFSNKKTVKKPKPEQPSCEDVQQKIFKHKPELPGWEDVPEKILHIVEPNPQAKTPEPTENILCVSHLSPPSFPLSEKKSLVHAPEGTQTAKQSPLSVKRNLRRSRSGMPTTNPPRLSSAKKNLTSAQSGIQAIDNSPTSCSPSSKKNLKPTQNGIQAANSSPISCTFSKNLQRTQSGIQAANSTPSRFSIAKSNLSRTQPEIQATNLPPSCPASPKKKGSTGTQLGTQTSSPAPSATHGAASSDHGETDARNQSSDLKKQYKNGQSKNGSISSKDEHITGNKLTFRRGKIVDPHPEASTPTTLKFRRNVLGGSENGRDENRTHSTQSRLSWPQSIKNTQPGIRTSRSYSSSLASMSEQREEISSAVGETDVESQILTTEKNMHRKDGANTLKVEKTRGQKLKFRRGKVVELPLADSTPTRLKFKKSVPGDSRNGEAAAARETVEKKEGIESQVFILSAKKNLRRTQNRIQSSRLSWPPSPKKKSLRSTELELGTPIARSYSCASSLKSLSMDGDKPDAGNKILDLEHEVKIMYEYATESDQVQKLSFKRGKVVDIAQSEDNAPRRLKFKRREGQLVSEASQNDQTTDAGTKDPANDNGIETESEDIASKEKDETGKKSQSLFNNVIEETVCELVKTRKSKVKALVGAFETLISRKD